MSRSRCALRLLWLGGVCAVMVGGCGGAQQAPARQAGVTGPQWILDVSALGVGDAGSVSSWLEFAREHVSGNDGCNAFSGSYHLDGSTLTFGPLAGTQMACGGPAGDVAREVTAALGRVRRFAREADTLRLQDAGGKTLLRYAAARPGVEGAWTAISVLYDGAIRSAITGVEPTADFSSGGAMTGSTGCNSFHGDYTLHGKRLSIGPLAATKQACPTTETSEQAAGYLAALESAVRIEQAGSELTLFNAKGQMAVTFMRR